MFGVIVAVLIMVGGSAIATFGPTGGPARSRTSIRLAGLAILVVGLLVFVANAVVVIAVGEVGVKHFLGRVASQPLQQGVHLINPLASVEKMSIREQGFPADGTIERM